MKDEHAYTCMFANTLVTDKLHINIALITFNLLLASVTNELFATLVINLC